MRRAHPPALATWLVEHAARGHHRESLAGDLIEEYRAGRSLCCCPNAGPNRWRDR
jgi:hypothetical protein